MLAWHGDDELPSDLGGVVLPGGFSYGDYLRCGGDRPLLARDESRRPLRCRRRAVLGICNGFQILCEAGLLPGVLRPNHSLEFVCADASDPGRADEHTPRLRRGPALVIPVKHGEGAWFADDELYAELDELDQIVFRYESDVNGALHGVAGVCNREATWSA